MVIEGSECAQSSAAKKSTKGEEGVWPNKRSTTKNANSSQGTSSGGVWPPIRDAKEGSGDSKTKGNEAEVVAPC